MSNPFKLIMLSAYHEQGGNVLHRFLDSHPQLMVYPMESTCATPLSANLIAGPNHWMPQRYAYPEFGSEWTVEQCYHAMADHELKTYLRSPHASKFRDCGLVMDEKARLDRFNELMTEAKWDNADGMGDSGFASRRQHIEAFFRATFDTWTNFARTGKETHYVGYIPPILMDADKFFADFPNGHMVHIVRNPWSGYADTIKRPFPFPLERYCQMWNVCSTQAAVYAAKYEGRFHTLKYEHLVLKPKSILDDLLSDLRLDPFTSEPRPSFNRKSLETVFPWGTIKHATEEANLATARELTKEQMEAIYMECGLAVEQWSYGPFYMKL
jgi:hypothetical protein